MPSWNYGFIIVRARQRVRDAIFANCLRQRSALPGGHDRGGRVSFGLGVHNAVHAVCVHAWTVLCGGHNGRASVRTRQRLFVALCADFLCCGKILPGGLDCGCGVSAWCGVFNAVHAVRVRIGTVLCGGHNGRASVRTRQRLCVALCAGLLRRWKILPGGIDHGCYLPARICMRHAVHAVRVCVRKILCSGHNGRAPVRARQRLCVALCANCLRFWKILPGWIDRCCYLPARLGVFNSVDAIRVCVRKILRSGHHGRASVRARQRLCLALCANCLRFWQILPGGLDRGQHVSFGLGMFNSVHAVRVRVRKVLCGGHDGGPIVRDRQRLCLALFANRLCCGKILPGGHNCGCGVRGRQRLRVACEPGFVRAGFLLPRGHHGRGCVRARLVLQCVLDTV